MIKYLDLTNAGEPPSFGFLDTEKGELIALNGKKRWNDAYDFSEDFRAVRHDSKIREFLDQIPSQNLLRKDTGRV